MKKILLSITIFFIGFAVFPNINTANASEVSIMQYIPVEGYISTEKNTYSKTEVVEWNIFLGGPRPANFDIHFSDSRGNSYRIEDLNIWNTTISMDYKTAGKVTAYLTVYGENNQIFKHQHTITIK